jgi:transcriptional regulator with XRE-family HTH domain
MTIGMIIRRARMERGLTQASVAWRIGTSQTSISYWENDQYRPNMADLHRLEQLLEAPIRKQEYLEVLLPLILDDLLRHGEGRASGAPNPPPDLAVVQSSGRLVASPLLLAMAEVSRDVPELLERWKRRSNDGTLTHLAGISGFGDTIATLDERYSSCPTDRTSSLGPLSANLGCGVLRPLLPRSPAQARQPVTIGAFIPIQRPPISGLERGGVVTLFDDPVHSAIMVLATLPRFPSTLLHSCVLVERQSALLVRFECAAGSWEGFLHEAVVVALSACCFVCFTPFGGDGWRKTVDSAVEELACEGALCRRGPTVLVGDDFFAGVASNPNHKLNRGEKLARASIAARFRTQFQRGEHV